MKRPLVVWIVFTVCIGHCPQQAGVSCVLFYSASPVAISHWEFRPVWARVFASSRGHTAVHQAKSAPPFSSAQSIDGPVGPGRGFPRIGGGPRGRRGFRGLHGRCDGADAAAGRRGHRPLGVAGGMRVPRFGAFGAYAHARAPLPRPRPVAGRRYCNRQALVQIPFSRPYASGCSQGAAPA